MHRRGVSYDVGSVMGGNWRPDYDPRIVRRELEIIVRDLHCTAVRITGRDLGRLLDTAEAAAQLGLEVWLSPLLWDKRPRQTLAYITKAAVAAEQVRARYPDKLVFSVGSELTLFMQGIIPGKGLMKRLQQMMAGDTIKSGRHNKPLNDHLARSTAAVRQVFHGPVTYASLMWEQVDWSIFDIVGVDHYWAERIKDRYLDMLTPLLALGKPVVVTEFGFPTTSAPVVAGALAIGHIDERSFVLHRLPVVGRFVRVRLARIDERDEGVQASRLVEQLHLLDRAGVDGAFVSTFIYPVRPYDDDPQYDLDRESPSLVKSYTGGKHGTTYPEMTWEPKESFKAVADFYRQAVTTPPLPGTGTGGCT
jgi:hypothetical protein